MSDTSGTRDSGDDGFGPFSVGVDGDLVERVWLGDQEVIVHHADIPESDVTTVRGIPCTTALRTIIDLAPDVTPIQLRIMVQDALLRRLFTLEQASERLAQADMADREGARLLRRILDI